MSAGEKALPWTPEPWVQMRKFDGEGGLIIEGPDGVGVLGVWSDKRPECQANSDRVLACVNACAGMADPAAEIAKLRTPDPATQRVIEAAKAVNAMDHGDACCDDYESDCAKLDELRQAVEALAARERK